jgi:hypothetical protein
VQDAGGRGVVLLPPQRGETARQAKVLTRDEARRMAVGRSCCWGRPIAIDRHSLSRQDPPASWERLPGPREGNDDGAFVFRLACKMGLADGEGRQATRNEPRISILDAFRPDGPLTRQSDAKVCSRLPCGSDDQDRLNSLPDAHTHQLCADTTTYPP